MTPRQDSQPTCDGCFFRIAALCALAGNTPCPTYRPAQFAEPRERAGHTPHAPRGHASAAA